MSQASNNVTAILNLLTFLMSIFILAGGLRLAQHSTQCESFVRVPVILIGGFIMVVSVAGFVGACFRVSWLLWIYLFVTFLLILLLLFFTAFAFIVTNKGEGRAVEGRAYKEYHLDDYSRWLQDRVQENENWIKIKTCIADANVCGRLSQQPLTEAAFYQRKLSPIQSGCCKPPSGCGFMYVGPTYWNGPAQGMSNDPDCSRWSNQQNQLCYDCNSCKAGVVANMKHYWEKVSGLNIVMLIILILVYCMGCFAFRNTRRTEIDYAYGNTRMTKARPRHLWT